ncbi:putative transmembrane protein Wzc [Klebsiella variicola]|uniref:Putative transmembrane protein Wzc n=1 Tax=Klebsiella variicola TaxID=244366 RepID=A0A7H4MNN6_KLEVA|nr:putative transmembrane protein Wzc [Klebsiella variicola]
MASVTNNKQTPTESDDIDLGKIVGELIDHPQANYCYHNSFYGYSSALCITSDPNISINSTNSG